MATILAGLLLIFSSGCSTEEKKKWRKRPTKRRIRWFKQQDASVCHTPPTAVGGTHCIVPTSLATVPPLPFSRRQSTADILIASGKPSVHPPGINFVPPLTHLSDFPYNY